MLIYKITNQTNGKIYIGKTSSTIAKRWRKHLNEAKWHDRRHLYAAINKYGEKNFTIETVEICNVSESGEREKHWIKYYNSMDQSVGYNLTEGGENGIRSEEYKRRISETLKKYFQTHPPPPNPTEGKFGELHHFFGQHHTSITKKKLSVARRGKKYEEVMTPSISNKLKEMHKIRWTGKENPSFREIPVEEIIKKIHEFPLLTIRDISEEYGVSCPTIINKFKEFTGMAFGNYKKEKLGFNHGIYKKLRNLGLDKMTWLGYSSSEQHRLGCKL
jgi:group I intron endonuclease